jgi:hypothetical protein
MMVGMMRRQNEELQRSILAPAPAAAPTAAVAAASPLPKDNQLEKLARERAELQAKNAELLKKIADAQVPSLPPSWSVPPIQFSTVFTRSLPCPPLNTQAKVNTADATVTSLQAHVLAIQANPNVRSPPQLAGAPAMTLPQAMQRAGQLEAQLFQERAAFNAAQKAVEALKVSATPHRIPPSPVAPAAPFDVTAFVVCCRCAVPPTWSVPCCPQASKVRAT